MKSLGTLVVIVGLVGGVIAVASGWRPSAAWSNPGQAVCGWCPQRGGLEHSVLYTVEEGTDPSAAEEGGLP
jgi:hypothetical protein